MPFYVPTRDYNLAEGAARIERLVVALWMNCLQSRVPTLLGPRPLSVITLVSSLKLQLDQRQLFLSTLSRQATAVLLALDHSQWLKQCTSNWKATRAAAAEFARQPSAGAADRCAAAIGQLLEEVASRRIESHLEFILSLPPEAASRVAEETFDLIADLIGLGHSESFLYGWGLANFTGSNESNEKSPRDRLEAITLLGRKLAFSVMFQVGPTAWIPALPNLAVGKAVQKVFEKSDPIQVPEGQTLALVTVTARDYKAAIGSAVAFFAEIATRSSHTSRRKRIRVTGDRFLVKRLDTLEELTVPADTLRSFEPPRLAYGVRTGYLAATSPELVEPLERCFYWLAAAAGVGGEAQFLNLWLALTSLVGEDAPERLAPLVARYRTLASIQALTEWILGYLHQARSFDSRISSDLLHAMSPRRKTSRKAGQREPSVVQRMLRCLPSTLDLRQDDLLLDLRLRQLTDYVDAAGRRKLVEQQREELLVLLPAARTTRHSIAHLAGVSVTSTGLLNRAIAEDIAIVADQVAASGLGAGPLRLEDIHRGTNAQFDALAAETVAEPHASIHHVRQGCCSWSTPGLMESGDDA